MGLKYKVDVVQALNNKGLYPQKIRQGRLLSESTMTKLRRGEPLSWSNIETICRLLDCQPGDIIKYDN